ncbi:MAG: hypothetical protein AAFN93_26775 [Bacteroidota bacterium]
MADLRGVIIQSGKIGANTIANDDGIAGLIIEAPATTELVNGQIVQVFNLKDVESYGSSSQNYPGQIAR